jgi:hypothetical protein
MSTKNYIIAKLTREYRAKITYDYRERYFNLWLNAWKWKGISREQREYIMRKFWAVGSVACFWIIKPEAGLQEDENNIGFAPFIPVAYNMYNFPTRVLLTNERGVPYIPNTEQVVGKDVVLGFAQHSQKPISSIVFHMIDRIVDVEMTIRTNLIAQKIPALYEVTPESKERIEDLYRKLMNDEAIIFTTAKTAGSINNASAGIPNYILDLYSHKVHLENELNTFLGFDNIGSIEKKERLVSDEANSNNAIINDYSDCVGDNFKEFAKLIGNTFNRKIEVEATSAPAEAKEDTKERNKEDGTDD